MIPNPYYDEYRKTIDKFSNATLLAGEKIKQNRTKYYDDIIMADTDTLQKRRKLAPKYAWAIPTTDVIDLIVSQGPLIEVGCGTGYWASLIRQAEGDIVATEPFFGEKNYYVDQIIYTTILREDHTVVKDYPHRTLLIIWPPIDSWCLKMLKIYQGNKIIYIGEGYTGCTGTNSFHNYLDRHFNLVNEVNIPRWPYLNDTLKIYHRKLSLVKEKKE